MRSPRLSLPINLSLAPVSDMPPKAQKVIEVVSPYKGMVSGAVVGAIAAYFIPKLLDRVIKRDESEYVDLESSDG